MAQRYVVVLFESEYGILTFEQDMVKLARRNAKSKGVHPPHIAFAQASFTEELPIESMSVDCILSNCVLNLLPASGKSSVLKEAFRVLKPGGRVHLADVILFSCLFFQLVDSCSIIDYCYS